MQLGQGSVWCSPRREPSSEGPMEREGPTTCLRHASTSALSYEWNVRLCSGESNGATISPLRPSSGLCGLVIEGIWTDLSRIPLRHRLCLTDSLCDDITTTAHRTLGLRGRSANRSVLEAVVTAALGKSVGDYQTLWPSRSMRSGRVFARRPQRPLFSEHDAAVWQHQGRALIRLHLVRDHYKSQPIRASRHAGGSGRRH